VTTYEILDAIADSVNPILGVIALTWPWLHWQGQWRRAASHVLATLLSAALAFGMSALDGAYGWWPSWGLDFSTHTALCVAATIALCFVNRSLVIVWLGALISYAALMMYQGYHTAADIGTTALVVAPPVVAILLLARSTTRV
jgi:hypothetical protein